MKMKTLKPLFLGGQTLTEGRVFVTDEQHGRELIELKYAEQHDGEEAAEVTLSNPVAPAGGALTSTSLAGNTATPPADPAFKAKHKGAGKWVVVDAEDKPVGDFSGTHDEAKAEAERLAKGGEPFKAPEE